MDFNISFERPEDGPASGPIVVGWFLTSDKGAVMYDPPERVSLRQTSKGMPSRPAAVQALSNWKAGISW